MGARKVSGQLSSRNGGLLWLSYVVMNAGGLGAIEDVGLGLESSSWITYIFLFPGSGH